MKYCHPEIDTVFDTECGKINQLVIENQSLFCRVVSDLIAQWNDGCKGQGILSINDEPVDMGKYADVISSFIPFDLNKKTLLSKLVSALEKIAVDRDHYEKTMETLKCVNDLLMDISFNVSCDVVYPKISVSTLLKSAGVEFQSANAGIAQDLLDYMELYREFDRDRLFFLINLRSYLCDNDMVAFSQSVLSHGYHILLIEGTDRTNLPNMRKVIIDRDLCEIE